MTCRDVIRGLCEYLDGELDPTLAQSLLRHLERCHDCRLVVDTTRRTIQIYCDAEPLPLLKGIQDRLDRALAEKYRQSSC